MDTKKLLENYKSGYNELQNALRELPLEMWDYKPAPDKWSIKDIIVHIVDSEVNGYIRFRKIIAENGSEITAYDQDLWADKLSYESRSADTNLELFRLIRVLNYSLLVGLPEAAWNNTMQHPERGKVTLKENLEIYTEHVLAHINQMTRNYDHWKKAQKA
jgi:uncharacterized damage-inducible protein DinB